MRPAIAADLQRLLGPAADAGCDAAPAPRIDLRTGALAVGVITPSALSTIERSVRAARRIWSAAGHDAPLSIVLPADAQTGLSASDLDDLGRACGIVPHRASFEFAERLIVKLGPQSPEGLRARGWGVALIGDPACPIPFGARARGLYSEIILGAPDASEPYFALKGREDTPLARRVAAAREAGLALTCVAATSAQARIAAAAGFTRAGGACAAFAL